MQQINKINCWRLKAVAVGTKGPRIPGFNSTFYPFKYSKNKTTEGKEKKSKLPDPSACVLKDAVLIIRMCHWGAMTLIMTRQKSFVDHFFIDNQLSFSYNQPSK